MKYLSPIAHPLWKKCVADHPGDADFSGTALQAI